MICSSPDNAAIKNAFAIMHTKLKSGVLHIIFVEVGQQKLISIPSALPNMHQFYLLL